MIKVDVCMASFNHVNFIQDAVESVIKNAEYAPLQLWIVDDGSTDGTVDYLQTIKSDFISVKYNKKNIGAGATINKALSYGSAELVSIINSDDVWHSRKLESQVLAYQDGFGDAIFTLAEYIDADGKILKQGKGNYSPDTFKTMKDWDQSDWLKLVSFGGNCLCTPSFVGRRSAIEKVGGYDNRFKQIPDIELWTRLFQSERPYVIPDKLVQFRLHDNNTSKGSAEARNRHRFEAKMIMKSLFLSMDKDVLKNCFKIYDQNNATIFDQIIAYLSKGSPHAIQVAAELIHENLASKKYESYLTELDLFKLSGAGDISGNSLKRRLNMLSPLTIQKFMKKITNNK
jgi:glycosyltransferase involved in cell wall biosynthesis